MAREYTVRPSDTLAKIAKVFYGDALIARKLAEYNGIKNPDLIRVNQVIEIPSQRELLGGLRPTLTAPASGLTPPNGLPEILATFGDIYSLIRDDGSWTLVGRPNTWPTLTCLSRYRSPGTCRNP
jgi:hypothetical protein